LVPDREPAPGARLRIAIASSSGKGLDAHFGSARKFIVYDVSGTDSQFVEVIDFCEGSSERGEHESAADERIAAKIATLAGCHLLLVLAIGGPVAAKVVKAGIHPIKVAAPESTADVIEKMQALMTGTQPPWLRKLLAPKTDLSLGYLDLEDES
jgi:nitrogen fixation protein NifX